MFYDLNIPCPAQTDRSALDKLKLIVSRLAQMSESTVALNYTLDNSKKIPKVIDEEGFDASTLNAKHPLKFLKRVTINTNESLKHEAVQELRKQFDLIALRTDDYAMFHEACQSSDIDIISLHCDERLAFEITAADVSNALDRNIYFEICYAPAIRDNQSRTYTLQVAKQLFEYTEGKNLIISSEAQIVSEIRNPADIFYFAKSIGLPNDKAKFTVEKHCEQLLRCVQLRK